MKYLIIPLLTIVIMTSLVILTNKSDNSTIDSTICSIDGIDIPEGAESYNCMMIEVKGNKVKLYNVNLCMIHLHDLEVQTRKFLQSNTYSLALINEDE